MLKSIGPNTEPNGTPDSNISKSLFVFFDLTFCLRRFRYE